MRIARWLVVLSCALGATHAVAAPSKKRPARRPAPTQPATQPDPAQPPVTTDEAKQLMQLGLKLFTEKNYLGALEAFKAAYTRVASARILLNIGTTLTRLHRKAEAANIYQRYLDSADADPTRQSEVRKVLAELDAAVAILELTVKPADAELQINDEDWVPAPATSAGSAASPLRHRIAVGPVTVRARHPAHRPGEQVVQTTAGTTVPVAITLVEIPRRVEPVRPVPVDNAIGVVATVERPRSQLGMIALAHVDVSNGGGAGLVGVTVDLTSRVQAQAAAILGPVYGGYAGARFAFLDGKLRPIVSAGVPIFASGGARFAARGAGGVELALNRHLAVIAEVGVEHVFNPEDDVKNNTLFIPAIGAAGRL